MTTERQRWIMRREGFFNGLMFLGVVALMTGIIGKMEILTVIAGTFIFVIWVSYMAVRRNDASRRQLEDLKKRFEEMQSPRPAASCPDLPTEEEEGSLPKET